MKETSLDVIKSIVEDLGGTSTAKTMVKVLKELKQALASGSSGGSSGTASGGGTMVVNITDENNTPVADKTYAEIMAQLDAGGDVLAKVHGGNVTNVTLFARLDAHRVNSLGEGTVYFHNSLIGDTFAIDEDNLVVFDPNLDGGDSSPSV